jgi:hydrophobic/amphiphilic exporter-1 (mainly G- bacteria), HAE1 family
MSLLLVFLLATGVVAAQEQALVPRSFPDPAVPARVGVGITQRQLSLRDAIEMALANNLEIEIQKTARDTAEQSVQAARGFFDPAFRWQPLLSTTNTPTGSVLQGASGKLTDRGFVNNFYLRQKFQKFGTVASLDFENARQTTTNPFTSFNPLISSRLAVGFTQPLLRGRLIDRDRTELRIRQKRVDASTVDIEIRVIDVITRVQQAYWDVVAARQDVAVKEENVNWAREQLAINQRLINAGTLAPVELSAAEAELQRRLDTWYSAIGSLTDVENNLKTLIAPERTASIWNDEIIPTEVTTIEPPDADDLRAAVTAAIKRRPELRTLNVQDQITAIEKDLNKDLTKPEVNLIAQYALSGLGGSVNLGDNPFTASNAALYQRLNQLSVQNGLTPLPSPTFGGPPDFLVGNYGTALSNLFGGRYQSFQAGLSIDFNLRNRTATANLGQTLINEKRLKLERARAEQSIEAQVRSAMQGIQTARQRIAAAEASTRAAKEKLDSEQRLYQTGESTNFLVLTRQNEYADSRRREVVARLDYNKSVARLEQALGTTLASHNVSIQ